MSTEPEKNEGPKANLESPVSFANVNSSPLTRATGSGSLSTFQCSAPNPGSSNSSSSSSVPTIETQNGLLSKGRQMDNLALNHRALYLKALKFQDIRIKLHNTSIWSNFSKHGTEMVITKNGRRMFPIIEISVYNLDPNTYYFVLLDIIRTDDRRYKYVGNHWVSAGKSQLQTSPGLFFHPDSPAPGSKWMEDPISFHKVKITNNRNDTQGNIILSSMHKYIARVHIIEGSDVTLLPWCRFSIFPIQETSFITVTAYQNPQIVDLKIENNPYARGFLCPDRHKKRLSSTDETEDSDKSVSPDTSVKRLKTREPKMAKADSTDISSKSNDFVMMVNSESTGNPAVPFNVPLSIDTKLPSFWQKETIFPQRNQLVSQSDHSRFLYSNNFRLPVCIPLLYNERIPPLYPICPNYYNMKHLLTTDIHNNYTNRYCSDPNCSEIDRAITNLSSSSKLHFQHK